MPRRAMGHNGRMARSRSALLGLLVGTVLLAASCTGRDEPFPPTDGDGDGDGDGDAGTDVEVEPDGDADEGPGPVGGPLTQVAQTASISEERVCDLDSNGSLDNSLADLGSPASTIAAMALNSVIQGSIGAGFRLVYHFPWLDDPSVPEDDDATMLVLDCVDGDDPPDRSDDFAGDESFYAKANSLDACGEPLHAFEHVEIRAGELETPPGVVPFPFGEGGELTARGAVIRGRIEPGGVSGTGTLCGYAIIHDLGGQPSLDSTSGLSLLELLLAGGDALGFAGIPGFRVDMDLDADGLESFVLDDRGAIVECVDGDLTLIPGRECWRDEAMADGFSIVMSLTSVRAELAGRAPGWEDHVEGTCTDPPEESLFDPR